MPPLCPSPPLHLHASAVALAAHITNILPSFSLSLLLPCHASLICMCFATPPPPCARLCHFQFCILIIKFCWAKRTIRKKRNKAKMEEKEKKRRKLWQMSKLFATPPTTTTHDYFVDDDNPGNFVYSCLHLIGLHAAPLALLFLRFFSFFFRCATKYAIDSVYHFC